MKNFITFALATLLLSFGAAHADNAFTDAGGFNTMLGEQNQAQDSVMDSFDTRLSGVGSGQATVLSASMMGACKMGYLGLDSYMTCPN